MRIQNAYHNNLKNISLNLPENQLIVVTGLSGSGKSSLAMGVIGNEGYRYFLESLPAYNQQNATAIPTALVDDITALPPVIKVEQSKRFQSINATFGTLAELTPIFRILFARYSTTENMSKSLFSFNHPKGACETCRGIGEAEYIDIAKLVGDENKTLREGAIVTTLPNGYIVYSQVTVEELNKVCEAHGFTVDIPWKDLTQEQKNVIWNGSDRLQVYYGKHSLESRLRWEGFKAKPREIGYYKGILPIMSDILRLDRNPSILRFASSKTCPSCHGARIKAAHLKYRWKGLNFKEWMELPLDELYQKLQSKEYEAGEQVLVDKLCTQLDDLIRLGMDHYRLSTSSMDISSGDGQRIKLIKQVNSSLQGILYVFDEPSIGLSPAYQQHLYHILRRLISRGNTVMVVEHDLNLIRKADWIVELGPKAGINGGEIIFNGKRTEFLQTEAIDSPTLSALHSPEPEINKKQKKVSETDFQPAKNKLAVVSRKTATVLDAIKSYSEQQDLQMLTVSDQPIGKTPRSNPATYTGIADKIRDLFAKTDAAKALQLKKSAFSFNNKVGRCPRCEGAGVISLSMSVMGTINQTCPACNGKRFKPEVLQVHWNKKNISEIYNLSISEAYEFFKAEKKLCGVLALLQRLGIGYLKLGQPSNTLSGGEAQRIKLTKHFAKPTRQTILLLEEPSIGLHQQNVAQLLKALQQLKEQTSGIVCFENHALFQAQCDVWINNSEAINTSDEVIAKPSATNFIEIKGARTHALKDLDVSFPKQKLSVVTGISGSGKSSLVIDTLHGYGLQEMSKQFSSYQQNRVGIDYQFEVDHITGLTPSICITRKNHQFSQRSDVAKQTDIDKSLRFSFSRKAQYEGKEWSASHFSNAHELGKCSVCDGVGEEMLPDISKIVLDEERSIADGLFEHNKALSYYGQAGGQYMAIVSEIGKAYGFNLNTPFKQWNKEQKDLLFYGIPDKTWEATWAFKTKSREGKQQIKMVWKGLFTYLMDEYFLVRKNKHNQHMLALLSPETCSHCKGSGLQPERLEIKIAQHSMLDLKSKSLYEFENWLRNAKPTDEIDTELISKLHTHLKATLKRAKQLHIDHLHLNRKSDTLSGGEQQRVSLIKQLNSPLQGVTYLLDEPSAGLSQNNIADLISLLKALVTKGNTVIVIEHHKDIMLAADHLVQIGPKAGSLGGAITFQGSAADYLRSDICHPYVKAKSKKLQLKKGKEAIKIEGIARHGLQKEQLEIPVGGISAITGKSGIGKTTLVKEIVIPSLQQQEAFYCRNIHFPKEYAGADYFEPTKLRAYNSTLLVDYLAILKVITRVFAKETGGKAKDFSYKNKTSQCPNCLGTGVVTTSLDVAAKHVETCDVCEGKRYRDEILQYKIAGKHVAAILSMKLSELQDWFADFAGTAKAIQQFTALSKIGLSHVRLDQTVKSLSSGEKQRLLLNNWLEAKTKNQLLILDEPSIGLHYADIDLLYHSLKQLSEHNDLLVIDHNPYLLEKIGVGAVLR
ncbi:ATP-binding cassette domain-containing protein [Zunongwangia profunda]|uniref:UvrABC system protein A n=4 Tax=Zunongwangia profunda TaxID=398743 RepID=D5BEB5_ZUNPS|nr:ATP-binding cassette domain-containing protein [Zunongwangia profunda]ADF52874.1 UvrABC system protein A-like protein [Zunongwangia profunda SM-A87]MAS72732.1 excinuclease ABC subunit A [Zunongwangia sp.]HAJ81343.1 excinuclease ABC subunit A [Zunongwangia profunda]